MEELERARESYAKKLKKFIIIGFAIFAFAIFVVLINFVIPGVHPSPTIFITLPAIGIITVAITAVIAVISTKKDAINYRKIYKAYFVERNLRQSFTDIYYNHEQGMSKEVLKSTDMIRTGDVYRSNDFTSGKYRDVAFSQADVEIQEEHTDSDGDTTYVTIFKGRWMVFEFPKSFNFRLEVVQKWFNAHKKPSKDKTLKRKIEKISTESPTFNKKFNVYAEDGFEAYYILDPAFIDHIEKLSEAHKGKLLLCFVDNRLHVGLNDKKDAFEPPSPFKPIDEKNENQKVRTDIKTITDFVDFLKLDRKLFKDTVKWIIPSGKSLLRIPLRYLISSTLSLL